jgi:Fur family ferric uptake transcriptional regulator
VIRIVGCREQGSDQAARERQTSERLAMTVSHRPARPLAPASVPAAVTALRMRGMRISSTRRLVLEALFSAGAPVSAEAIARGLDGRLPASDVASVYRNLEALEAAGLVRHVHLGHGAGLYALAGRREQGYAACERCGTHAALGADELARLAAMVREACGYEARFSHFPIVGRCPQCAR